MSLGFNVNRKIRTTNLPGAVGASVPMSRASSVPLPSRTVSTSLPSSVAARRVAALAERLQAKRRLSPTSDDAPRKPPPSSSSPSPPPPPPLRSSEEHWVFGTASSPLLDRDTSEEVASEGERVLLVYPMESDERTGRVHMRLKRAHPVTGQLSYAWVGVYDPDTDVRSVRDFAVAA